MKTISAVESVPIIKIFHDLFKHYAVDDNKETRCQNATSFLWWWKRSLRGHFCVWFGYAGLHVAWWSYEIFGDSWVVTWSASFFHGSLSRNETQFVFSRRGGCAKWAGLIKLFFIIISWIPTLFSSKQFLFFLDDFYKWMQNDSLEFNHNIPGEEFLGLIAAWLIDKNLLLRLTFSQ